MAEMSYRYAHEAGDDDPTEELQILPGGMMEADEEPQAAEPICAANQAFKNDHLDAELRDANERVVELSSELCSRTETMQSIQRELERLRDFSEFLEKEVESGKGVISDVTDQLISVRTQQNDVSERLRRREKQITVLRDKLAKKDLFIEEFARRVDLASASETQDHLDSKQVNESVLADHSGVSEQTPCQNGHAQRKRLRMLVARNNDKATTHPVLAGGISVGTSPDNDVQLEDVFVSHRHATITETASGCLLKDLDSSNGTWINQRRIKWQVLRDGDLIDFGPLRFEFIDKHLEIGNAQIEDDTSQ